MNKEEILEKSRKENRGGDERDRAISAKAKIFGVVGFTIMFFVLSYIKMTRNERISDLLALYFSFFAANDMFCYHLLKEKKYLFTAICFIFSSVIFMILFILER